MDLADVWTRAETWCATTTGMRIHGLQHLRGWSRRAAPHPAHRLISSFTPGVIPRLAGVAAGSARPPPVTRSIAALARLRWPICSMHVASAPSGTCPVTPHRSR